MTDHTLWRHKALCKVCGRPFLAHRIDKRFCSKSCLMKNYRRTQRAKLDYLEDLIAKLPGHKPSMPDLFA